MNEQHELDLRQHEPLDHCYPRALVRVLPSAHDHWRGIATVVRRSSRNGEYAVVMGVLPDATDDDYQVWLTPLRVQVEGVS